MREEEGGKTSVSGHGGFWSYAVPFPPIVLLLPYVVCVVCTLSGMPEMSRGTVSAVASSMVLVYMARSITSHRLGPRLGSHGHALFIHLRGTEGEGERGGKGGRKGREASR